MRRHARVDPVDGDFQFKSAGPDVGVESESRLCTRACCLTLISASALRFGIHSSYIFASSTSFTQRQSLKKRKHSYISRSNQTNDCHQMDDQDLSVLDSRLSLEQHAYRYSHRYVHLKSILVPALVDKKTHYSFLDISVEFIKRRPTSDLELVFKDSAGVKHQSNKFKKSFPIYWSLDMSVYVVSYIS